MFTDIKKKKRQLNTHAQKRDREVYQTLNYLVVFGQWKCVWLFFLVLLLTKFSVFRHVFLF